jgi:hypothetical protein
MCDYKDMSFIYPIKKPFDKELIDGKRKYLSSSSKKYLYPSNKLLLYRSGDDCGFIGEVIVGDEITQDKKNKDYWTFIDPNMNAYIYNTIKFEIYKRPIKLIEVFDLIKEENKGFTSVQSFYSIFTKGNCIFNEISNMKYSKLIKGINKIIEEENDDEGKDLESIFDESDEEEEKLKKHKDNSDEEKEKKIIEVEEDNDDEEDEEEDEEDEILGEYEKREMNAHIPIMIIPNSKLKSKNLRNKKKELIKNIIFNKWEKTDNNDIDFMSFLKIENIEWVELSKNNKTLEKVVNAYLCQEEFYFEPKTVDYPAFRLYHIEYEHEIYHGCYILCFMTNKESCEKILS